jgi:hypothetical protein
MMPRQLDLENWCVESHRAAIMRVTSKNWKKPSSAHIRAVFVYPCHA